MQLTLPVSAAELVQGSWSGENPQAAAANTGGPSPDEWYGSEWNSWRQREWWRGRPRSEEADRDRTLHRALHLQLICVKAALARLQEDVQDHRAEGFAVSEEEPKAGVLEQQIPAQLQIEDKRRRIRQLEEQIAEYRLRVQRHDQVAQAEESPDEWPWNSHGSSWSCRGDSETSSRRQEQRRPATRPAHADRSCNQS